MLYYITILRYIRWFYNTIIYLVFSLLFYFYVLYFSPQDLLNRNCMVRINSFILFFVETFAWNHGLSFPFLHGNMFWVFSFYMKTCFEFFFFVWKHVLRFPFLYGNMFWVFLFCVKTCFEFSFFIWKHVSSFPFLYGNVFWVFFF